VQAATFLIALSALAGSTFDETRLKALSPGSSYIEPQNELHFARTGGEAAVVRIVGIGPTGTRYRENPAGSAASR
jgi:hypothetical protein